MEKVKAILKVIEIAIKRESRAFRYYINNSKKSEFPEVKSLLLYLAEEEKKHETLLLKEYQVLNQMLQKKGGMVMEAEDIKYRLPKELTFKKIKTISGVDVAGISLPAETISGDFLDSYPIVLGENKKYFAFILYDVMGHGVSASHLRSVTRSILQKTRISGRTNLEHFNPRTLLTQLNKNLYKECQKSSSFVTAFYCLIDIIKGEIRYSSAGHVPPILISAKTKDIQYLSNTEIIMGIDPDRVYTENKVKMNPGDALVIYSDGITEAVNNKEEMFEIDRVKSLVSWELNKSSEDIINSLLKGLKKFIGRKMLRDDLSVAVIKLTDI